MLHAQESCYANVIKNVLTAIYMSCFIPRFILHFATTQSSESQFYGPYLWDFTQTVVGDKFSTNQITAALNVIRKKLQVHHLLPTAVKKVCVHVDRLYNIKVKISNARCKFFFIVLFLRMLFTHSLNCQVWIIIKFVVISKICS